MPTELSTPDEWGLPPIRRRWLVFAGMLCLVLVAAPGAQPAKRPDVDVFVSWGCPHCAAAEPFIEQLRRERPDLVIRVREVGADTTARRELIQTARLLGVSTPGVPAFLVGGHLIIGFDESGRTETEVRSRLPPPRRDTVPRTSSAALPIDTEEVRPSGPHAVNLPWFGEVSTRRLGLPLFSVVIGFVDGVNPCAMWALLYILTLLATLHDRRKMLVLGGTFVAVGGVLYFAFIAAWLELFLLIGLSRWVQVGLGSAAVIAATLHVKDAITFGHGPSLIIPTGVKPLIFQRARRVLTAENMVGAVVAVALLSVLVNVVELLCTAGLPAVYTQILASQDLGRWAYYGNLALYIAAYVLDDSIVLGAAVVTLSHRRLQQSAGRWLKLVSGLVLLALGLVLLMKPGWLA